MLKVTDLGQGGRELNVIRRLLLLVLFVALVFAVGTFIAQNNRPVGVTWLWWDTTTLPLYLLVFFSILLGATVASLVGLIELIRSESRARKLAKKLKVAEEELGQFREGSSLSSGERQEKSKDSDDYYYSHQNRIESFKKIS